MRTPSPYPSTAMDAATRRTYEVRTYGCQMNVHDSERMAGTLESAGMVPAEPGSVPDVVVLNTCAVRENADNRLYGNLGHLAAVKRENPGMQIAVGGCLAQKDQAVVQRRAPWVDVVFGTHNIGALPALLARAAQTGQAQAQFAEVLTQFPSELPRSGRSTYSAWVSISVGCDNTCTFCIVPALRGRERDRDESDVLAEIGDLVAGGVIEVTLLGQNVNAYGRARGDREAFSRLLRRCGQVAGLERVRFTSPHPRDFSEDVIAAMAQTPNVMPALHMPLQSGSDRILAAMRRSYRRDRYLRLVEGVRTAIPDASLTTDIIVGFPGETEEDFQATLDVVASAQFDAAFTFQYSPRPGTPAASMPDQVPHEVVSERYLRLTTLVDEIALERNDALIGREVEVLVGESVGRKDQQNSRVSGRARDNRLVHVAGVGSARPGDAVMVRLTEAAPHHLSGEATGVRRTRAGDAWTVLADAPAQPAGTVSLGMPAVRSEAAS